MPLTPEAPSGELVILISSFLEFAFTYPNPLKKKSPFELGFMPSASCFRRPVYFQDFQNTHSSEMFEYVLKLDIAN
jgi:hypothetical protein